MRILPYLLISIATISCTEKTFNDLGEQVVYLPEIKQIMENNCVNCHNNSEALPTEGCT